MILISKISNIKFIVIAVIVLTFIVSACADFNIYPPSEDIKLGKNLAAEIKKNTKEYPILNNSDVKNYVQGIVNTIIKSPIIEYRGKFAYSVEIINRDDIINAFCAPGGYIYVYTGLLKFIDNEATLSGILAHEIAHAERRHATQRISKAYGTQLLSNAVLGENKSKLEDMAANMFSGLSLLNNSREDEYEADEYSFKYLQYTPWYPGAIKFFFDKIKSSVQDNDMKVLLSTHPLPQDRYDKVIEMLKKANVPPPNEKNTLYRKYLQFKKSL
jgi:predicted Zn-dependent protease